MKWEEEENTLVGYIHKGDWYDVTIIISKKVAKTPKRATDFCKALFKILSSPPDGSVDLLVSGKRVNVYYNSYQLTIKPLKQSL